MNLESQLADYGQLQEEVFGPISIDEITSPVVDERSVDVGTRPPRTPPPSRRWVWALIAAAVVLLAFLPLLLDRSNEDPVATTIPASQSGWVAFAGSPLGDGNDIYLVGEGQSAFRVAGSDSDGVDQLCPVFSPDGARLAYGEADGTGETGYANGILVVADVNRDGSISEAFRVDMGPGSAPPCATWSPDGEKIAVGVRNGDWGTPGDIWLVPADNGSPTVLEGMYVSPNQDGYSDMEWSPEGTELAVTGLEGISLYSVADGGWRLLDGTRGATSLTWSPGGTQIAYEYPFDNPDNLRKPAELRLVNVDGSGEILLADDYDVLHGIGPVWSPTGDQIVHQRSGGGEYHRVFLVTPEGSEVVLPELRIPEGDETVWYPYRVSWSPDGSQVLYLAWAWTEDGSGEDRGLIAVPTDGKSAPVMLHQGLPRVVLGDGNQLAFQSWGGG